MWKIALSGMKGRKKDTLLLSVVITLSFIFIITSTILHESSEQTKLDQRIAMFGSWDTAYLKGNESIHNELSKLEDINKLGASRIIGNSETLGTVGTINKELEEIGYFQMYEGRMPENENEIAIEVSQLGKFPKEIKVGDIIPVEIKIGLFEKSEGEINKEAIYRFVEKLYPSTRYGLGRLSVENVRDLAKKAYPTKFGKTWVYVYAGKNIDDVKMNVELKRMAREKSFKLVNYKEGNQKIFNKSFNISAIIAILGAFVGITIMFILYNSAVSELEQERGRIGIFQALGVTGEEFSKVYLFTGLGYGLISLVASHVILAIGVLFMSIGIGRGKILWLYPWSIHIALSIIVFAVIVMTYYLPIRKILKHQPIYNIEGLSR